MRQLIGLSTVPTQLLLSPPAPLDRVFAALREQNGNVSEQTAALLMQCSTSRFRHRFKELTGETYQATRLRVRMSAGATLLKSTEFTVPQISAMLHYSERSKFDNAFKKVFGLTTTEYRRRLVIKK